MKSVEVFDVVQLKDNERGTILNISGDKCLVEIPEEEKRQQLIDLAEIEKYTKVIKYKI